jgi:hypothetical protein
MLHLSRSKPREMNAGLRVGRVGAEGVNPILAFHNGGSRSTLPLPQGGGDRLHGPNAIESQLAYYEAYCCGGGSGSVHSTSC